MFKNLFFYSYLLTLLLVIAIEFQGGKIVSQLVGLGWSQRGLQSPKACWSCAR